jgi:hypothetical protein
MALLLLAASPAVAEVPGGHAYFGVGGILSVPLISPRASPAQDLALSLEFAYEFEHALLALDALGSGFTGGATGYGLAAIRGGWIFGEGSTAPYLSAGLGYMSVNAVSCDRFGACTGSKGDGLALVAEAGLLFLRDQQVGRVALMAQFVQPLFELKYSSGSFRALLIGLRLFI